MVKVDVACNGTWVKYSREGGKKVSTKSYTVWAGMNTRCLPSGAYQRRRPTYAGCYVSQMFKSFQWFTDWHVQQVGYDQPHFQLDKDILIPGNKLYSEDTCVLLPRSLNNFLTGVDSKRTGLSPGVHFCPLKRLFVAQISVRGIQTYLGQFETLEEAACKYSIAKEADIKNWVTRLTNSEFVVNAKVVLALQQMLK